MFQVVTIIFSRSNIEKQAGYSRFSRGPQKKSIHMRSSMLLMSGLSETKNTKCLFKIQYSRVLIAQFLSKFKFLTKLLMFEKKISSNKKMSHFSIKNKNNVLN